MDTGDARVSGGTGTQSKYKCEMNVSVMKFEKKDGTIIETHMPCLHYPHVILCDGTATTEGKICVEVDMDYSGEYEDKNGHRYAEIYYGDWLVAWGIYRELYFGIGDGSIKADDKTTVNIAEMEAKSAAELAENEG